MLWVFEQCILQFSEIIIVERVKRRFDKTFQLGKFYAPRVLRQALESDPLLLS